MPKKKIGYFPFGMITSGGTLLIWRLIEIKFIYMNWNKFFQFLLIKLRYFFDDFSTSIELKLRVNSVNP